jgi:hypothetical protein
MTPRLQFKMRNMLVVVALLAVPMMYLKHLASSDWQLVHLRGGEHIYVRGTVHKIKNGLVEVKGGAIRAGQGNKETQLQADRIVVKTDGTADCYGDCTVQQRTR